MRPTRHPRFSFALLSSVLSLLLATVSQQAQSPAPQAPTGTARPSRIDPHKAKKALELGLRAERAGDWPAAFQAFDEAAGYAPGNADAVWHREAARFQMVQQHTDRAEREALGGRLDLARAELEAALKLDPGYSVARERLMQFERAVPQAPPAPSIPEGLVRLQPRPGRHDFNLRADVHAAYEEVARQFGVVASFDADLPARLVRFRVTGVDFETAMTILGELSKTFWRPVDAHTFFVAEDTPQKRRDFAPVAVRTVLLPSSITSDRMTEILRLVREIAGVTHIDLDTRTRTLTLRDLPANVVLAAALIEELEQAPGELMLEIEILEVDRNVSRRLGITPPSTARLITINPTDVLAARQARTTAELLAIIQRVFGTAVPPVVAFGGGRTIFLATLPGAAADFAQTLSLVRSGRRVLLRAQDGQPATFFVGERFPVALALLGASLVQPQLVAGTTPIAFPRADFITGKGPVAVAVADFNGDGKVDLAVTNHGSVGTIASSNGAVRAANVVTITTTSPHGLSTGQGVTISGVSDTSFNGTFTIATVPSTTTFTYAQTGSDATSGGGTVSTGSVSILLGNGDGTFKAHVDFPVGPQPTSVAVGDFNGDGKLDLVVTNQGANNVSILLGNGDGTFQTQTTFATGTSPSAVIARDFDGDGKLDLAVANATDNTVSILLGKGDGTFQAHVDFATGTKPVALVAGDFNADTKLDLAVANSGSNNISILLGNGDGTFQTHKDFGTGVSPSALVAADFNADGKLDLAVANESSNNVSILLGRGDGTFSPKTDFATGNAPAGVVAADFNLDGKLDLAVANQGSNTISLLLGKGDGTFGTRLEIITGAGPTGIIGPDVNGDARPDVVTADQNANAVTVILNPAASLSSSVGVPQTAYPGAEYEDLGLKVRATPRMHADSEVTLQLDFEIRALAGTSINGIPVISNRTVTQAVRLRQNETTLISGILQKEETRTITGLPGLAHAPGIGHLAGRRDVERQETELLILITPRQLRLGPHTGRSIYAGRGESPGGAARPQ